MTDRPSPHELFGHPWAIREEEFRSLLKVAADFGARPEAFSFLMREDSDEPPPYDCCDGVAIIKVRGALFRSDSYFSRFFASRTYPGIARALGAALEDGSVESIVLDIDSPGGDAIGITSLVDTIFAERGAKPITAFIGGLGASAAYWIASSASKIVAAREAIVGGIGVVATFMDWSRYEERVGIREIEIISSQSPKKRPNPATDEGRSQIQVQVDDIAQVFAQVFAQSVSRGRGVPVESVLAQYGEGDVLVGQRALDAGMIDELGTLDEVIAAVSPRSRTAAPMLGAHGRFVVKTIELEKITAEWLRENRPEVASALRAEGEKTAEGKVEAAKSEARVAALAEGAEAERVRIQGIEDVALPGHEELIATLKADPKATPASAAAAVVAAEKAARAKHQAALAGDESALVTPPAPGNGKGGDGASAAELAKQITETARKAGVIG